MVITIIKSKELVEASCSEEFQDIFWAIYDSSIIEDDTIIILTEEPRPTWRSISHMMLQRLYENLVQTEDFQKAYPNLSMNIRQEHINVKELQALLNIWRDMKHA